MADNSAFISYRRKPGFAWARLIWEDLVERGVDAFLDLEDLRTAGRFDERLLKQIAARPYFLIVLTEGTLERCVDPTDWVRREIEHAIENDRSIVPVFIAPFEPSGFPPDLPQQLREALSQYQGVTVYNQYLEAAVDKLVEGFLVPVDVDSIGRDEEDARFESEVVRQIKALPPPDVADTPASDPPEPDAPAEADTVPPIAPVTEPILVDLDPDLDPAAVAPTTPMPTSTPPTSTPPEPTTPMPTTPEPFVPEPAPTPSVDDRRRKLLTGLGVAAAVVLVAGVVAFGVSRGDGDGGGGGGTTTVGQIPPVASTTEVTAPPEGGGVVHAGRLGADVWLRPGDVVEAAGGAHRLVMTDDGRLLLRTGQAVVWQPPYSPRDTASAILQRSDGNFVVYADDDAASDVLWASDTNDIGEDATLEVIDDDGAGYVVIEDAAGSERWRMPDRGDAARDELDARVASDLGRLNTLVDVWVVQLSAKADGQDENGTWDHERILDEFDDLADEFEPDASVVLALGRDFNLNRAHELDNARRDLSEWYFTLLLGDFGSRQEGIDWCEANRPGNCGVKLLSDDPLRDSQAYFSPDPG